MLQVKKELLQYLDGPPMDLDDFILYTAPPKEILRTDAPLHKLGSVMFTTIRKCVLI